MFYEVTIHPHHGGFGMWQSGYADGEGWTDQQDLIDEIAQNVHELYELGGDEPMPPDVTDIRGRIYNQPGRVFAFRREPDDDIAYCGIVEQDA